MSIATIKKQMNFVNQKITEKVSGVKLTEKGDIYNNLNQRVTAYKKLYEEMMIKVADYLQPNPGLRAKIAAASKLRIKQDIVYPQIESEFAEVFLKYRDQLGFDNPISEALNLSADAFVEVASYKYTNEANIRNNFICHMVDSLEEIKKISNMKKDLESKRLEFDKLKRASEKTPADPNFDVVAFNTAKANFFQSLESTTAHMALFLDSEFKQIDALTSFVLSIIECQKDSITRLTELTKELSIIKETSAKESGKNIEFLKANFKTTHGYDPAIPCCIAMFDFEKQNDNELALKENDMITLISQVDANWYKGSKGDQVGFFPCNYVKVLVPLKM